MIILPSSVAHCPFSNRTGNVGALLLGVHEKNTSAQTIKKFFLMGFTDVIILFVFENSNFSCLFIKHFLCLSIKDNINFLEVDINEGRKG